MRRRRRRKMEAASHARAGKLPKAGNKATSALVPGLQEGPARDVPSRHKLLGFEAGQRSRREQPEGVQPDERCQEVALRNVSDKLGAEASHGNDAQDGVASRLRQRPSLDGRSLRRRRHVVSRRLPRSRARQRRRRAGLGATGSEGVARGCASARAARIPADQRRIHSRDQRLRQHRGIHSRAKVQIIGRE